MSWKNELRKENKESDSFKGDYYIHGGYKKPDKTRHGKTSPATAKTTPPSYRVGEIEIYDKSGRRLSTKEQNKLLVEVMASLSNKDGRYKEILDEANVSIGEFTKYLQRKKPKKYRSSDFPAV